MLHTTRALASIKICTSRFWRTLSKARLNSYTGTGCSDLIIAWNLHGHLLETCYHTQGMK